VALSDSMIMSEFLFHIGRRGVIPELLEKGDKGLRSRARLYDGSLDELAITENADNLLSVRRCELHHAQSTQHRVDFKDI